MCNNHGVWCGNLLEVINTAMVEMFVTDQNYTGFLGYVADFEWIYVDNLAIFNSEPIMPQPRYFNSLMIQHFNHGPIVHPYFIKRAGKQPLGVGGHHLNRTQSSCR